MNISVDERRNALIVTAPEALFLEVKQLVQELDYATPEMQETIRYGQTAGASATLIRDTLTSLLGEEESASSKPATNSRSNAEGSQASPQSPFPGASPEEVKRRMDFLRAVQATQKKAAAKQRPQKK